MSDDQEFEAFLRGVRALTDAPGGEEFTRQNILALLDVLTQHLNTALAVPLVALEDGTIACTEHPAAAQLRMLVAALRDLEIGLTDAVLKPNSYGANATRPWQIREKDQALDEALTIFQSLRGIKQRKQAAMCMAKILKRNGYTRKGQPLNWQQLLSTKYKVYKQ